LDAYLDLLHDDLTVIFHKFGVSYDGEAWVPMLTGIMANEKFIQESSRCVYENDDVLVQHSFMSSPDGTREAVILVAMIKGGKISRLDTGETPLD
tara:strand:- start:759 stop:1043 length:285 start_codon:yes stop_codon:yes gene_type:complete